jgi:hypothetical protein
MPTPRIKSLDSNAEKIEEVKDGQAQTASVITKTSDEKDADTRQAVAKMCIIGYFAGLVVLIVGVPLYNYLAIARTDDQRLLLDFKDALITYQAVVGTLVGTVVAYYFKSKLDSSQG